MSGNFVGGIIGAAIGTTVGLVGPIKSIRDTQKAMKESYLRQMETLMLNYNYNQNALNEEQRYTLAATKQNLFNLALNSTQNNAQIFAAQGETGYEGRTAGQITRAVEGQVERRRTSVIDSYEQQIKQIKDQRDALYIQTKRTVDQAEDNFNNMQTSDLENVFNVMNTAAMAGYQGFMIGSGIGGGFGGGAGASGASGASTLSGSFQGVGQAGGSSMLSGSFQGVGQSGGSSMLSGSFLNYSGMSSGGGGGGWRWDRAMQSFNQVYSKQSSIQNMFSQFGALGQSLGALFGNTRSNRYNFIY